MHEPDTVQIVSDDKSQNQTDGRADQQVDESVFEHFPEFRIGKKLLIVGDADKFRRAHQIPIGER
ncbi:hypothetical protein FQZ97_942860 [compost metagenome]